MLPTPLAFYLTLFLHATIGLAAETDDILLFSFFRDNGQGGIFLAHSADGLTFTSLNNDQAIMPPGPWPEQKLTRDPSIVYHEGIFRAVWTTGWKGTCFAYAESKDLVTWSTPKQVFPFTEQEKPKNVWAPEICWDPQQQNFMIFWASTLPQSKQKIFLTRTTDGKTFTPATLFVDPPFSCIDSMLVLDQTPDAQSRWVMVYKNAEKTEAGGQGLRIATAPLDFAQSWATDPTPIIGNGSAIRPTVMAEGCSLLKTASGWRLYWDSPLAHTYHAATSTDLKTWADQTDDLHMPLGIRHGTVFRAPRAAVGWLNNGPNQTEKSGP